MKKRQPKSDSLITLGYLGIAALLLIVAFFTYPWIEAPQPNAEINKPLFDWESLSADNVASLEIIRYDETSDQLIEFRVEKNRKGIWTIPSSEGYPADAEEQLRRAVTSFSGITVIDVIANKEQLFEERGVLEPDRATVEAGQQGVGVLVTMKDRNGGILGSVIIGKSASVKGEEDNSETAQSTSNLRFVRKPGQPLMYVIDYDPSVLTTDFRDWIDKDVLDLDVIDIASVAINDYQVVEANPPLRQRYKTQVRSEGTRWQLEQFIEFDDPTNPVERTIGTGEELNNVRLNKMAESLGSLEVVDVARKPAGVNADLTVVGDENDLLSLRSRGFVAISRQRGVIEIFSMNGEMTVDTKDGISYLLRFGKNRPSEEGLEGSLDRYMMVSAYVNEDRYPMPQKPELLGPGEPGGGDSSGPPKPPGGDAPPPPEGTGDDATSGAGENPDSATDNSQDALDNGESCQDPGQATTAQESAQDRTPQQDLDEERRRRETEYRRQVELRNEQLRQAQNRVDELNRRFGDWYYVISEESFKNLRVERDELIIKKGSGTAAPTGGTGTPLGPRLPNAGGNR